MNTFWNVRKPSANLNLAIYPDDRSSNGLIGCWLLNEGTGNVTRNIVNGRCADKADLQLAPVWTDGNFSGKALQFGSGAYVRVPSVTNRDHQGSVIAWIKTTSLSLQQSIVNFQSTQAQRFLYLGITTGGKLFVQHFDIDTAANNLTQANTTVLSTGTWYQVVWTSTGSAWTLYVNAVAQSTSQGSGTNTGMWQGLLNDPNPTERLFYRFGWTNASFSYSLAGIIDHVMVWNRPLTQTEIMALYNQPFLPVSLRSRYLTPAQKSLRITGAVSQSRWFLLQ